MARLSKFTFPRLCGRALLRRCPWCGGKGAWFRTWFRRNDRCNTCGLRWNRGQDGFELGAMTVAVLITGGSVMIFLAIFIASSYPDFPVAPMAVISAAIALVMPFLTYPLTQTIWSAFDLRVHPPLRGEFLPSTPAELLPAEQSPAEAARAIKPTDRWASPPTRGR
jgi:uncharacterized protein (DUF983 family)